MQTTHNRHIVTSRIRSRKSLHLFSKKTGYTFYFFTFVIFMLMPLFFVEYDKQLNSDTVITLASFALIGLWSFTSLYFAAREKPFTINCSHWIFFIFFFFYAPLVQFLTSTPPAQTNNGFFDDLSFRTNITLLLWCVFYSIVYGYTKSISEKSKSKWQNKENIFDVEINYFLLLSICFLSFAASYMILGVGPLLSRSLNGESIQDSGKATTLVVNIVLRAIPTISLALSLCDTRPKDFLRRAATLLIALTAILLNSPFAVARFWFGAFLIGILCIIIRNQRRSALWLPIASVISLLYILPILNLGRYNTASNIDFSSYQSKGFSALLTSGDFDAYSMLVNTIAYKENFFINEGQQLWGNLLFFYPRSRWEDKPYGSGQTIAEDFGFRFTNLSEPLPAEGYINFGIIGVAIYACFFAWLVARLDFTYWKKSPRSKSQISVVYIVYPFGVGFTLFFMRGDFLSGISYISGFVVAAFIVISSCSKRILVSQSSKP